MVMVSAQRICRIVVVVACIAAFGWMARPAYADFSPKNDFAVGTNTFEVKLADLNGDGKLDVITANQNSTVSVLLNTTAPGAPTPTFATIANFAAGTGTAGLALADLNGDGRPDVVVTNPVGNNGSVLLNKVTPGAMTLTAASFTTPVDFATGAGPRSVALADLNGDGRPDIVTANETGGTVSVLLNTIAPGATSLTAASFTTHVTFTTGAAP